MSDGSCISFTFLFPFSFLFLSCIGKQVYLSLLVMFDQCRWLKRPNTLFWQIFFKIHQHLLKYSQKCYMILFLLLFFACNSAVVTNFKRPWVRYSARIIVISFGLFGRFQRVEPQRPWKRHSVGGVVQSFRKNSHVSFKKVSWKIYDSEVKKENSK